LAAEGYINTANGSKNSTPPKIESRVEIGLSMVKAFPHPEHV